MKRLAWEIISTDIKKLYYLIFKEYNLENLTKFEKRNIIFDYIVKNVSYDFETLQRIKDFTNKKITKANRDSYMEFVNVLYNKIGICNAISQLYILLLEEANIFAQQICASDGSEVLHAFTVVESENGNFSFDDPTSVIVERGTKSDFFDYGIKKANQNGQGNDPKLNGLDNPYFCIVSAEWLFAFLGRIHTKPYYLNALNNYPSNYCINQVLMSMEKTSC